MQAAEASGDAALDAPKVRSGFLAALEKVRRWRRDAEAGVAGTLRELQEEAQRLEAELSRIQEQLEQNAAARDRLVANQDLLDQDHDSKLHEALLQAFQRDASGLAHRAERVHAQEAVRRKAIDKALRHHPDIAGIADEQARFAELDLASLPESYRQAMVAHHQAQGERLRAFLTKHDPGPTPLSEPPLALDVAWTLRFSDTTLELRALMPVDASARTPAPGDPSLPLAVFARILQGLHGAAAVLGAPEASLNVVEVHGLLGVHATFPYPSDVDVDTVIGEALEATFGAADELSDAHVVLHQQRVGVDLLASPAPVQSEAEPTEDLELEDDDAS